MPTSQYVPSGGGTSAFDAAFPASGNAVGGINVSTGELKPHKIDDTGALVVTSTGGGGGGASTIADGADVAEGATADLKVTGDNSGTLSAKLRGLNTVLADVWDSVSHFLKVSIQNATLAVTQSGTWTVTADAGTNLNTSTLALETGGNLATLAGGITAAKYQANVAQVGGTAIATGNGTSSAGVQRVALVSDQTAISTAGAFPTSFTRKSKYGTSNQAITCTFTSLTNNSARQSTAVDNTSNLYEDVLIFVKIKAGASSTSATGSVNLYALGTTDGGTTYTESAGASDAAITLTSPPNAPLLGTVNVVANAATYNAGPFSLAMCFGGRLPDHWGIVVQNLSGGTLDASVGSAWYQGVYAQGA